MSTTTRRETAKIFQFPRRPPPVGAALPRYERSSVKPFAPAMDWAGAWYHEAALQEDARGRKS
jgi:hypothetical protein